MSDFKVGDRVVVIDLSWYEDRGSLMSFLKIGAQGTVSHLIGGDSGCIGVILDDDPWSEFEWSFMPDEINHA